MDEQQTAQGNSPIYQQSDEKNAKWLWLLIALIIIGALVFAFFRGIGPFAQFQQSDDEEVIESPVAQSFVESPSPSPEEEEEIDKSEPVIRVLNGSGIAGAASSFQDFLEGKGWSVDSLGNADEFEFENTVIKVKEGFEKFTKALTADLEDDYSVEVSTDVLEATDSADIEITVGSK